MSHTRTQIEQAILWRLGGGPKSPVDVTDDMARAGFAAGDVRNAYARMLDRGVLESLGDLSLKIRTPPAESAGALAMRMAKAEVTLPSRNWAERNARDERLCERITLLLEKRTNLSYTHARAVAHEVIDIVDKDVP